MLYMLVQIGYARTLNFNFHTGVSNKYCAITYRFHCTYQHQKLQYIIFFVERLPFLQSPLWDMHAHVGM